MANSINSISSGTGGLQSTADGTSGNLLIQKDAGTIATFSASGVVVSGVVAATTLTGDGSALSALNATNLTSGTVPDARFPATLPALNGSALTALNATNLGSGTVPTARLGSGTASNSVFLRGDGSWQTAGSTSASDLTSGTLPMARLSGTLPALNGFALTGVGKLLQQVETVVGVTGNINVIASAVEISTSLRLNITVLSSTSKLRISFNPSSEIDGDTGMDTTCFARIYNGSTLVATTISNQMSWRDNDTNSGTIVFNSLSHGTSAGTVIQVRVYIISDNANGAMDFGQFGSTMTRVEEIG